MAVAVAAEVAAEGVVVVAETDLPFLGAGVSYRDAWRWEVIRHREALGLVECIPDDVAGEAGIRELVMIRGAVPVTLHGIGLSLGSTGGLDPERVRHVSRVAEAVQPPWMSEHIAFTRAGGIEIGHLTALPFTREAVATVAANAAELKAALPGLPLLLENIAYPFPLPGAEMTEAEFVRAVIEESDAGLLLDLENVHANAANHGYDPIEYLESLPLDRVAEVHLAGGIWEQGQYVDTHTRSVPEESWTLLEWLVPRTAVRAVVIERDGNLPPFEELLAEVRRAEEVLHASR